MKNKERASIITKMILYIGELGKKIYKTEKELNNGRTDVITQANTGMELRMEGGSFIGRMERSTKENSKTERLRVLEFINGPMNAGMKANGKQI